jgi:hypothetical protein
MIVKTARGRFRVRVKDRGVVVADRAFGRWNDAQAWEADRKRQVAAGRLAPASAARASRAEVYAAWACIRPAQVGPRIWQSDQSAWATHIQPRFGRAQVGWVTTLAVHDFATDLRATHSAATVQRVIASLIALMEFALDHHYIEADADRLVPLPRLAAGIADHWSRGKDRRALLVPGPDGGPLRGSTFRRQVHWDQSTPSGFRIHDLRHTCATNLLKNGADILGCPGHSRPRQRLHHPALPRPLHRKRVPAHRHGPQRGPLGQVGPTPGHRPEPGPQRESGAGRRGRLGAEHAHETAPRNLRERQKSSAIATILRWGRAHRR